MSDREKVIDALTLALDNVMWAGDVVRISPEAIKIIVDVLKGQDWISVKDRLPEEGVRVLAVKKLKDGRRDLALASCIPEYKHHDYTTGEDVVEPYWVCGGNNNITHWQPLPELPEVDRDND